MPNEHCIYMSISSVVWGASPLPPRSYFRKPTVADTKTKRDDVMENDRVIVKFHWCGPCKKISPHYKELSSMKPTVKFVEVDVDILEDVSAEHKIDS